MQAATAIDHWKGDFGKAYTERQADNIEARAAVLKQVIPEEAQSILEVGANVGANLEAIRTFRTTKSLYACEPNEIARQKLLHVADLTLDDTADTLSLPHEFVDLAFTCGVLIHVPPDKLERSMRQIHRVSKRWIICGEYFAPKEEEIPYRGQSGLMWRRDYGSLYMDLFPDLKCTKTLFAWKRTTGLDNLTFWVFEKS